MKNNWLRKFIERVDSQTDQELFNDLQAAGYTLEQLRAALADIDRTPRGSDEEYSHVILKELNEINGLNV